LVGSDGLTAGGVFLGAGAVEVDLALPIFRSSKEGFKDTPADEPKPEPAPEAEAAPEASPGPVKTKQPVTGLVSEATNVVSETKEFSGTSTPASAKGANANVKQINEKVPPANQPADLVKDGFNGGSGGLFKLGEIPTDEKGGYHIDAGTSVLNALKSLKPDQISAMTQDTKQLIETQKTLMNMLQSFKPMMAEGKDMMDTFQQMFSPKDGSAMGALQAAQNTLNN
jgi:hypothetical protein